MMFVYTQAFYYFAHRVQDTLEEEELPHIVGLKRSVMITILRRHLIEHPYRGLRDFGGSHGAMSSNDGPIILVRGQGTPPVKLRPRADPGLFSKGPGVARSAEPGSDECIGGYPTVTPTGESAVDSTPRAQGATSPGHPRWAKGGVASSLEDVSAARRGGSAPSGRVGWHRSPRPMGRVGRATVARRHFAAKRRLGDTQRPSAIGLTGKN
jgi:hypothetical protein